MSAELGAKDGAQVLPAGAPVLERSSHVGKDPFGEVTVVRPGFDEIGEVLLVGRVDEFLGPFVEDFLEVLGFGTHRFEVTPPDDGRVILFEHSLEALVGIADEDAAAGGLHEDGFHRVLGVLQDHAHVVPLGVGGDLDQCRVGEGVLEKHNVARVTLIEHTHEGDLAVCRVPVTAGATHSHVFAASRTLR